MCAVLSLSLFFVWCALFYSIPHSKHGGSLITGSRCASLCGILSRGMGYDPSLSFKRLVMALMATGEPANAPPRVTATNKVAGSHIWRPEVCLEERSSL